MRWNARLFQRWVFWDKIIDYLGWWPNELDSWNAEEVRHDWGSTIGDLETMSLKCHYNQANDLPINVSMGVQLLPTVHPHPLGRQRCLRFDSMLHNHRHKCWGERSKSCRWPIANLIWSSCWPNQRVSQKWMWNCWSRHWALCLAKVHSYALDIKRQVTGMLSRNRLGLMR